jgi:Tetratricopeptide repeat
MRVTVLTARHRQVVEDLADWWSDICQAGIGSRIVLVEVPRGWGATTVLREFGDMVVNPDAPVTISISVDEVPLFDRAIEASALREALLTPFVRSRLAHLLGLDTPAGKTGLALSVGGLFVSGMAVQLSLLMTSLGVTAAGNAWDDSPAGQQGGVDKAGALKLFKELLPDQIRILGNDHPDVLDTRENIASFTADCGDSQSALRLSRELLSDKVRVLGRNHPDVLLNRSNIAYLTGMCGDAKGASRLFQELLPDQTRVLGRNHPDVHTTRNNIVFWGIESTGTRQARAKKRP